MKKKEIRDFKITEKVIAWVGIDSAQDYYIIALKEPWSTYLNVPEINDVTDVTLFVSYGLSTAFLLVSIINSDDEAIEIPNELLKKINSENVLEGLI